MSLSSLQKYKALVRASRATRSASVYHSVTIEYGAISVSFAHAPGRKANERWVGSIYGDIRHDVAGRRLVQRAFSNRSEVRTWAKARLAEALAGQVVTF